MPPAEQLVLGRVYALKDVRIFFRKTGRMKFISHLDLNRFMIRMIRRSGIPIWYSEGFNPHPYITFAMPLSLGFESSYDIMDMRLDDDSYPLNETLRRLQSVMPDGIELFGIGQPLMKVSDLAFAEFLISYDSLDTSVAEELRSFLALPEILTEKKSKKGKMKSVDLAPNIKAFDISENELRLVLTAGNNNLNPKLLLETFEEKTNKKLPFAKVVRTMLYNSDMQEFV